MLFRSPDGGYVIAGTVTINSGSLMDLGDLWAAKLDSEGRVEWQKVFSGSKVEIGIDGMSVIRTSDGGYALSCRSNSFTGEFSAWVLRLDGSGNVLWQKVYEQSVFHTHAAVLRETQDGGLALLSSELIRMDASGNVLWTRSYAYAEGGDFELMSMETAADGGFILAGRLVDAHYIGYFDGIVMKTDASGNPVWKVEMGSDRVFTEINAVRQVSDGYVAVGASGTAGSMARDFLIVKLSPSGALLWQKRFDLKGDAEEFRSVDTASDGSVVAAGHTNGYDAGDIILAKFRTDGTAEWIKKYDAERCEAREVRRTVAGYAVGGSNGLGLLISVDPSGAIPNAGSRIQTLNPSLVSTAMVTGSKPLVLENSTVVAGATQAVLKTLALTVKDL